MKRESQLEADFLTLCRLHNLPKPIREFRFDDPRRWRFDFAFLGHKMIAVEMEGGVYSGGRHTRGAGFEKDCEKYNRAAELGWFVFRYTRKHLEDGSAVAQLRNVLVGL